MNNKRATTAEVAREAGVSHMTVSRVLNNFPHIRAKTCRKVLSACRKLNYQTNLIAAGLRTKKSGAIGVIVPTFQHTYYARFLASVEEGCSKEHYHIVIIQGRQKNRQNSLTLDNFEFLLARQVDGLIIDMVLQRNILDRLKKRNIPAVFVDVPPKNNCFSFIGTADREGVKKLTEHFFQLGHRRIAFFAGPKGHYTSERRLEGYRAAFTEAEFSFDKKFIFYAKYGAEGGYEAAKRLLADSKNSVTAIIGANDYIAFGVLAALAEHGIKVPEKISVAGFTGDEIGEFTVPPLTTMVQPIEEIGRKAVEIILSEIKNPQRLKEAILLPATLLKRSSVVAV